MQGHDNDYPTVPSSNNGNEIMVAVTLVLIGAIVFIAGAIAEWESTDIFGHNYILIPLTGFALGALITTALLWLLAIFVAIGSIDAGDNAGGYGIGMLLIIAGLIAILVVAVSEWRSFEWFGDDILIIPIKALQLVPAIGVFTVFIGTLLITAVQPDPDKPQSGRATATSTPSPTARELRSRHKDQEEIRRIARQQGESSEDTLDRVNALERELAALKAASSTSDGERPADETEDDDGDEASQRSKEIAELIRRANQD